MTGDAIEGKARYIFPVPMSEQMVPLVTCLVTCLNLGLCANFLPEWMHAFFISWPVAADAAIFAIPVARRAASVPVDSIERRE